MNGGMELEGYDCTVGSKSEIGMENECKVELKSRYTECTNKHVQSFHLTPNCLLPCIRVLTIAM